jgi:hypothetical protein
VRAPLARAVHPRRSATASSHGVAADRRTHHGVPLSSAAMSRLRHDYARAIARRAHQPVWATAHGIDCLSHRRVSVAAPGRAALARRGAADSDQCGEHAQRVGRGECGGGDALRGTAARAGGPAHAQRRRDWPSDERRETLALDTCGPHVCVLYHRHLARAPTCCGSCSARLSPGSSAATGCRRT